MYLEPALPYDKSGGPFIPPARLEVIRQYFSPFLLRGQTQPAYPGFALVGIFGSGIKVAVAGTTILPERRKTNAGEPYLLAWLAFGWGILQKKLFSHFFVFQRTHPMPAVSKFNISNTY